MVRLKWDNEDFPMYQTGVSHGVFYGDDGVGHAWSGLISVTEKPQNNAPTAVYNAMGEKYDNFGNVAEKKHGLACYIYPEVMDEYLGYEYLEDFGYMVDERPPKKFHMAYRVELGNGLYEIHVLLNQIATFGETARQTIADSSALSTITMNLEGAVDPRLGTSHIRLDSRLPLTKSAEVLLFGDQYTDPNIHEFLTAEPIWETVATNYAPIIEPDYDNMVWLGGENLIGINIHTSNTYFDITDTGRRTEYNNKIYRVERLSSGSPPIPMNNTVKPPEGSYVTSTIDYEKADNSLIYANMYQSDGLSLPRITSNIYHLGDNVYREVVTFGPVNSAQSERGFWPYMYQQGVVGDVTYLRDYKLEVGSVSTPWVPPKTWLKDQDPYVLPTITPENYKPGIKKSEQWLKYQTQMYYDELNQGLGLYPIDPSNQLANSRVESQSLPRADLENASVAGHFDLVLNNALTPPLSARALQVRLVSLYGPWTNQGDNMVGTQKLHTATDSLPFGPGSSPHGNIQFLHGGGTKSGVVVYKKPFVSTSNYTGDFFDVYTKPKTKGDRYRRVETPNGDYTIHQQLRLRSTSKVKLSDITQYDFWLEAADSMLLSQNETFTFNGPQAVIDGDTFTIDDSIQGYEEG